MLKTLWITIFLVCLFSFESLAQSKSQWYLGGRLSSVSHGHFKEGNDFGAGLFVSNKRPVWSKHQLIWNNELGFDALLPCNRPEGCRSWWYERSARFYTGLEKNFILFNQNLSFGAGVNFFYGSQMSTRITVRSTDHINNVSSTSIYKSYEQVFSYFQPGARIGYQNKKFTDQIHFYLGYDWIWNNHLTSFSMYYRIRN
ncbi:TonB-dependent receptor [Indibacter alkaliphilus LW1]|uniref:TonB-dependent receptor n=1 Tax=Indibacter alkaliphilus (strain CCUG 57479 / KCTC 22604 / LW1) TaxID=1189612 RepID=S2DSI5_INDAL|nr:hypothetical protein [Indibacter alkaliphilus]EPA00251.1 TonB-dependent receptor [Indibacter alkaliphilus LW1]